MKKGRGSSGGCCIAQSGRALSVVVASWASLYRLLEGGQGRLEFAPVAQLLKDRQAARGRWRLWERRVVRGEHVPDRFGEAAGEVDLGDLGAPLLADARFRVRVALAVGRMRAGLGGGLDQRPTEVARSLLGKRAAQV